MVYKSFDKKFSGGAVPGAQSETFATEDKSALKMKLCHSAIHPFSPPPANPSPSYIAFTPNQNKSRFCPIV